MLDSLFRRRKERQYPQFLVELVADMFAIVQYWEPPAIPGCERGRVFEEILYRYCENRKVRLAERAGSRPLHGHRPASGLLHETDAVIATPDMCVRAELKHLTSELCKNELLVFNQKGLDFLFAKNEIIRQCPLYRLVVSATVLSPAARQFALQWGIMAIEPDRLPLLVIHALSGHQVPELANISPTEQDEIWNEVPRLITPLQDRVRQLSQAIEGKRKVLSEVRIERCLKIGRASCRERV